MTTLRDQTVVVIGGAGGIGSATAAAVERAGGRATRVDVVTGPDVIQADARDPAAMADRIATAVGGQIHALVYAAGVHEQGRFPTLEIEEWDRVLEVNTRGFLFLVQELLDQLAELASIVAITSVEESIPVAVGDQTTPAYAASKAALGSIVKSLAPALGARGVRVNAVAPGLVETPLAAAVPADARARAARRTPLGRWATPDDIAAVVVFLLSADAGWVTGTSIAVDGGFGLGQLRGSRGDAEGT